MHRFRSFIQDLLKSNCLSRKTSSVVFIHCPLSLCLIALLLVFFILPARTVHAEKVTIGWDANEEPDLLGYTVYRNTGKPGPPYNYSDEILEAELEDPLHPKVTLTGLKKNKEYYVALTAYNTEGVESSFSNDVCIEVVNNEVEVCSQSFTPVASGSSGGGGGGGGGGCFITTAGTEASLIAQWIYRPVIQSQVLAMLFLLLVFIVAVKLNYKKSAHKKKSFTS